MKTYHGFRDDRGNCFIEVRRPGQDLGTPLVHQVRHSPTGFEWGYGGSGPSDTARSILADHLGFVPAAAVYQRFKFMVVAALTRDSWTLTTDDLELSIEMLKADLGVTCLRCMDRGFIWKDDRADGDTDDSCNCRGEDQELRLPINLQP